MSEESHEYGKIDINKIKGEYIKANITEDKIAILIDDDVRILNETKKFWKNKYFQYMLHLYLYNIKEIGRLNRVCLLKGI